MPGFQVSGMSTKEKITGLSLNCGLVAGIQHFLLAWLMCDRCANIFEKIKQ